MAQSHEKDLYSILGVTPDAKTEKIREAYLARARIVHPDRIDAQGRPQDWKKANEILAELNDAYSILHDSSTRAQYDEQRAAKQRRDSAVPPRPRREHSESHPLPSSELGDLTPGQSVFSSLPKSIQDRLLRRQRNIAEDQYQVALSSVAWNYVFIVVLVCWFCFLFADAQGAKWENVTLGWYGGITVVIGVFIGGNCVTVYRYAKAKLKPYFYVTPIYFLKTEFDVVSFRPIWTLKDVSVTHNYTNGSYQGSNVILKFDGYNEALSISSIEQVKSIFIRIRAYEARLQSAYDSGDHDYFLSNDDFRQVPRYLPPTVAPVTLLSKSKQALIYTASMIMCAIGLIMAIATNEVLSRTRWVRHEAQNTHKPQPLSSRVTSPTYPERPLPYSGAIRTWAAGERIAPFEIRAAKGSNYVLKLVKAYTDAPIMTVFVRSGATVEVEVPLGTYEVRYASGDTWYGYEYLFGPDTSYSKADKTFTFEVIGNQVSGFTITLFKVPHGNLHTSAIKPTDF